MGKRRGACKNLVRKPEGKRLLEDPGVNGRIILKCILKIWYRGTDWIYLVHDRGRCPAVVNAVMNLRVP